MRQRRRPHVAAHRKRPDRSGLDERHHAGDRTEEELGVAGNGRRHRRTTAPKRHMDGIILDAGSAMNIATAKWLVDPGPPEA